MMPTSKASHIPALTGIRFLAALMIFVFHYADRFGALGSNIIPYFKQLFLGVEVFFVLSGFIIAYTYFDTATLKQPFIKTYFIRRVARILPLYLLLTIASFFIIKNNFQDQKDWTIQFILNLSLLKGFSSNYHLTGIVPTWSLTVEETFYALAPFIFVLIKRRNILFLQVPVLWLVGLLLVTLSSIYPIDGFFGSLKFTAFVTFFGRCFEFYCGIWLALQFKSGKISVSEKMRRYPVLTFFGLLSILAVLFLLVEVEKITTTASTLSWVGIAICNLVFPLGVVIFLAGLLLERSWFKQILSTSIFQLLGRSSYAFFLVHTGIFATAYSSHLRVNILVLLILLLLTSILLYYTIEKPLNSLIRRYFLGLEQKQVV